MLASEMPVPIPRCSTVEAAALITHITTGRAPLHSTSFTAPKDYFHAVDPLSTPDYREWIETIRKEYHLLDQTMGCWEIVAISLLPDDANLIGVKWVFRIKFKNGVCEDFDYSITSRLSRRPRHLSPG